MCRSAIVMIVAILQLITGMQPAFILCVGSEGHRAIEVAETIHCDSADESMHAPFADCHDSCTDILLTGHSRVIRKMSVPLPLLTPSIVSHQRSAHNIAHVRTCVLNDPLVPRRPPTVDLSAVVLNI